MRGVTQWQGQTPVGAQGGEACCLHQACRPPRRRHQRAPVPRVGEPEACARCGRAAGPPRVRMEAGRRPQVVLGSVPATRGRRGGGPPGTTLGTQQATPALCVGPAAPLAARRAQRLGGAVSHGRRSGGGPDRRGRGGVRGPASTVVYASCLGVRPPAPVTPGAWHSLGILPRCGADSAQTPSRCAGEGQAGRRGATPRGACRAHAAPNNALEPTPTASARTSLRLSARLTAGVGLRAAGVGHGSGGGKPQHPIAAAIRDFLWGMVCAASHAASRLPHLCGLPRGWGCETAWRQAVPHGAPAVWVCS